MLSLGISNYSYFSTGGAHDDPERLFLKFTCDRRQFVLLPQGDGRRKNNDIGWKGFEITEAQLKKVTNAVMDKFTHQVRTVYA